MYEAKTDIKTIILEIINVVLQPLINKLNISSDESKKHRTGIMLWDANGLAPGMNKELKVGLEGIVDELLLATTDNHYVNVKPGGFNTLSNSEGLLPSA